MIRRCPYCRAGDESSKRRVALLHELREEISTEVVRRVDNPSTWPELEAWLHSLDDDTIPGVIVEILNTILSRHSDIAGADAEFYRVVAADRIAGEVRAALMMIRRAAPSVLELASNRLGDEVPRGTSRAKPPTN